MPDQSSPTTITELWYRIDKRLALIEKSQMDHCEDHIIIQKELDDHETRLRSGLTFTSIMTGTGGFIALIAIIKSFIP